MSANMSKFVHLHTHSHYSLLDGLSKVEALVKKAKEFGMEALAITDHGNMHCAVEFYKKAKEAGIKPIIGVEVYMAKGSRLSKISNVDNMRYHLTLLAKNEVGYRNLCKLVTASHLEGFYYKPRIDREILEKYHDGLICLSGCFSGEIAKLLRNGRVEEAEDVAIYYKKIFHEDYYLEIQPHSPEINDKIIELSRKLGLPLVATQDSHYTLPEDKPIHEVLLAVQTNNRLDGEDRFTFHDFNVSFKSQEEMANDFKHLPEAIENTVKIAAKCNFEFKLGQTFLPKYEVPDGKDANSHLRELVQERLPKRFSSPTDEIKERLEYELGVIEKTGFADYFLIVQDFINWAKSHGIVVGPGRGSAAGSLVSYVLGITDVDPLKYNLLFERFLNPERISMPDIDIDFADRRRDEVLGYIKDKYGEDRVAQIITFGTMAARAAVRDAGRALGLSYSFCDEIARLIPFHVSTEKTANLPKDLESVPELKEKYEHDAGAKKLLDIAMKLEGVARHASVHACGVVISPQPLVEYMPLQRSPQDEKAVITQLEMHSVEDLGLLKIDLLGLKNLTIIEETVRLIRETRGIDIKISDIPLQDKETFELLQTAETTGVFQFECLSGDTLVSNTTLKKLYEKRDKNKLESVYVDEGKIHKNRILNVVKSGVKDVYALIAENGWYIKATKDHNFLTDNGWKRLIDLKPGDKVLLKNKARHLLYNLCETCGKQISGQKEGKSRFCYECSARFYSNPSKQISRTYMKAARTKFFENGGEVWNKGVNVQNNEVWRETAKKISVALTGISLEARYGREKSEQIKKRSSQRFSGSGNPMFGKPSPHRKGGVRNDLQHYVRSNWEADFARILNLYGVEYEYEPKMFVLRNSRGGIIHYTPDFYVKSTNTFYEIKGWMHDLDQEKINLFQEQYSQYNFVLINKTKFAELALRYKNLVRWECPRIPERSFKFLEVKEIKYAGKEETYDIAMEAPGNNFVANGFVVHNSSGMRRYMKDLKPTELEDLVALVALFRPGPMELIPSFISRKFGREKIEYLHPKLEPILKNTYGVGVYQEQMMRIARDLAGFTLSEADTLRKAIGKKIKSLLDAQKGKLINGMIKNGIDKKVAEKIWELFPPFARYGFNRCLSGDTIIVNPENGKIISLENLYKKRDKKFKIFSLESNLKIQPRPIIEVFYNGKKPVLEVTTRSGRKIKATANHPFLTPQGWQELENIKKGAKIATPRIILEPLNQISIENHKLGLLGYLLAEGNFCHPHSFYFYSKSKEEINDYVSFLESFENTIGTIDKNKPTVAVYAKRKNLKRETEAVFWIESLGLKHKKATEKFFPDFVYQLPNNNLALLLGKMFQGDGCINFKRKCPQIFYATSSVNIAYGFQHFLLRFGILSSVHKKKFKYRGGIRIGYTITINRYDNIQKFIETFGKHFVGKKDLIARKILQSHPIINKELPTWSARGSYDIIPVNLVRNQIREVVYNNGLSLQKLASQMNISTRLFFKDDRKIGYLRETINLIARKFNDQSLFSLAESDIYWDEIKKIEKAGTEKTYDLSIDETHNFIANDIIVHNSHAVCYALIGYQTAYLKANYPVESMTALLNNSANDVERISLLINEARRTGIAVLPPDVNKSVAEFVPEGQNIRFGILAIKNIGTHITEVIVDERMRGGPFTSISDFVGRIHDRDLNKKSLEALVKSGALDSLGVERMAALKNIDDILRIVSGVKKQNGANQANLFGNFARPEIRLQKTDPASKLERLSWEKELLGLYVTDHPLKDFLEKVESNGKRLPQIKEAYKMANEGKNIRIYGIISKIQRKSTRNGSPMIFAKIEDLTDNIEVLIFDDVLKKNPLIWEEGNILELAGRISRKNGEPKIICNEAKKLAL